MIFFGEEDLSTAEELIFSRSLPKSALLLRRFGFISEEIQESES